MIEPTLDEVVAYGGDASHAVLCAAYHADIDTPITVFDKLAGDGSVAFLLESADSGGAFGRWSFLGARVHERLELQDGVGTWHRKGEKETFSFIDPLVPVQQRLADWSAWSTATLPPFHGGAVGYIGFDCIRYFEPVPMPDDRGLGLPEAVLLFCDEVYAYDHLRHRLLLLVHVPLDGDREVAWHEGARRIRAASARLSAPTSLQRAPWPERGGKHPIRVPTIVNRQPEAMRDAVVQAKEAIGAGEVFQVVISQRLRVDERIDPFVLYRALRALNPSPYMFLLRLPRFSIVGASPEVLVRVQNGDVLVRPIAGTRPRGRDDEHDRALAEELLADEKEVAEHRMLLDLGRNDVGRVAEVGTVVVEDPMHIERYSHVMHIVSDVRGELDEGRDMFDALRAGFPAGTVSGAPKVRACELLAELEPDRRGPYAGAVGYFGVGGDMDTAIAIRTLVVKPDSVHVQAGAGIVWDSDPETERRECHHKANAPLAAVELAIAAGTRS